MNVRVLMLEAPEAWLEERARKGLDRRDEMWDGVLHVVPQPYLRHQRIVHRLAVALDPTATALGLEVTHETGLYRPGRDDDYRVPDLVIYGAEAASDRGVEGAAHVVIEVRSPGDESHDKLPFYLDVGVREVVVLDRDSLTVEVFRPRDAGGAPLPAEDTSIATLDVTIARIDDDRLRLSWPGGAADVQL